MNVTETDCAAALSDELLKFAEQDARICVVVNDSGSTHHISEFARRHPGRNIDVGIAEQTMVGVAAGLATFDLRPVVYSAACFLTARALEQIKTDIAYDQRPVVLLGLVSGLSYGALGGTHHGVEDIGWLRSIPGLTIFSPATPRESRAALASALRLETPSYIRVVSKEDAGELFEEGHIVTPGALEEVRPGTDVTLVGTGVGTCWAARAAQLLAEDGIDAAVVHCPTIEPFPTAALQAAAARTGRVVSVEEHVTTGGLGSAVAETLVNESARVLSLGTSRTIAPIGPPEWLREHFGISPRAIAATVRAWLAQG